MVYGRSSEGDAPDAGPAGIGLPDLTTVAALFEASTDAIALIDGEGRFRFVTPAIETLTGCPAAVLIGTAMLDLVHPDERSAAAATLAALVAAPGGRATATHRFRHASGEWRVAEGRGRNRLDDPRVRAIVVNVRDVTERVEEATREREREQADRRAAERDAAILNALPERVALLDHAGRVVAVNATWRTAGEARGLAGAGLGADYLGLCDAVAGEGEAEAREVARGLRAILAGQSTTIDLVYPCHDAHEQRWFRVSAAPFESPSGCGAVVVHADETARVLAEQGLREAADRYRRLVELSPEPIAVHAEGRLVFANRAALALIGAKSPEEAIGRPVLELVHPDSLPGVIERLAALASGETEVVAVEETLLRLDGTPVEVETAAIATVFDGRPAIQVILRDNSARKRAAEELRHARDEALRASRLKSAFLATMSHEIRTPLNVIVGYAHLLDTDSGVETPELVDGIRRAARRLLETIHGILDISRIESGTFELEPVSIDVVECVRQAVEEIRVLAREKKLELRFESGLDRAEVRFDRYCLTHALLNLVSNAIKFTPAGSVVLGLTANAANDLELSVRDTGIGMDPAFLPRLFEAFSQEQSGYTREFEGSGLGLALTRRFLGLNGASISVVTERGRGTTFTIRFPAAIRIEESVEVV